MVERLSVSVGATDIHFETGRIAKQAQGAVLVTCGETMVLSAVCVAPEPKAGQDFFPLQVDYREKSFAAGRIPGNFFRREGRPSEREVLVCRMTDRPLRPLFPKGFNNEVQVFSTVFSADNINNPDVMSINGASAALAISNAPFEGPVGAVRIGFIEDQLMVNPVMDDMEFSALDLVVAGTKDAITMVEGAADEISEDTMLEALDLAHREIKRICETIEELQRRVGAPKIPFEKRELDPDVVAFVESEARERLKQALSIGEKHPRQEALDALKGEVSEKLAARFNPDGALDEETWGQYVADANSAYDALLKEVMRRQIIEENRRLDGRDLTTIRPITIEVGILPRAHGSCLFTRGETQALVTTTLGTSRDEQRLDELTGDTFRRFMLHYNFPSWSVGEVRRITGPGRREVGHGKLAERALEGVIPHDPADEAESDFPYTIRVVSDITESNGSSSMASVCGGTMSLMDAGVPIKAPVAGIAMGLIKEGDEVRVLTDILGAEDHLGDMDFKVCGTRKGITAFQMDCKVMGVPREVMSQALHQARDGRLYILDKMEETLAAPRPDLSPYAPRITTIKIPVDSIGALIGPGGKVVRDIQTKSGAEINIEDDGTVSIAAVDAESAAKALAMIEALTATPEVGKIYHGTVSRVMNFGAFVAILDGNKEGLVHISELAPNHVREVTDVVNVGDRIDVKLVEIDSMGRINFSKVAADVELGRLSAEEVEAARQSRPSRGGGDRGGGRDRDRDHGRGGDRDRGGRSGGGRDRDRGRGGYGGGRR